MTDSIQDKPFTVQAGKRYVRRDGSITEELKVYTDLVYIFKEGKGYLYTRKGRYWASGTTSKFDLISEYIEPTAELQDGWGSWEIWDGEVNLSNADTAIDDNGATIAYRIKKEPVVVKFDVWIDVSQKTLFKHKIDNYDRRAIITLTDGEIDIEWAT